VAAARSGASAVHGKIQGELGLGFGDQRCLPVTVLGTPFARCQAVHLGCSTPGTVPASQVAGDRSVSIQRDASWPLHYVHAESRFAGQFGQGSYGVPSMRKQRHRAALPVSDRCH
jgi:hypothetical protein